MKRAKVVVNISVIVVSIFLGLLFCEIASRLFLRPSDYLSVEMVRDDVLGAVPSSSTRGHGFDEWGFRNPTVPETVDIVVIGDSQTYGNTATMEDSWPYVLGHLTGRSVYNMALGGYGPNQYFHLLKTRALSLKPRLIIVGLSLSDDFDNAYLVTYGLDHWAYLRGLPDVKVDMNTWDADPIPNWHQKIRAWLSRHSITYQLIFHGPLLGHFKGKVQIRNAHQLDSSATSVVVPERNIEEAFQPKGNLRRLDQNSESVREGMRITFKLLEQMKEISRQSGIDFLVTVIPTKEIVFSEYLEHKPTLPLSDVLDKLLPNERLAIEKTFAFLIEAGISYADPLPALKRSVSQQLFARSSGDMHPNRNGYRVIAEAVFESLKRGERSAQGQSDSDGDEHVERIGLASTRETLREK